MLWAEKIDSSHKLLFHGSKGNINGSINVNIGRKNNDFGQGFYTGDSYAQATSFVFGFEGASLYYLGFDSSNLKCKQYYVDQEWMMTIAYYRGALEKYKDHEYVKSIIEKSRDLLHRLQIIVCLK